MQTGERERERGGPGKNSEAGNMAHQIAEGLE